MYHEGVRAKVTVLHLESTYQNDISAHLSFIIASYNTVYSQYCWLSCQLQHVSGEKYRSGWRYNPSYLHVIFYDKKLKGSVHWENDNSCSFNMPFQEIFMQSVHQNIPCNWTNSIISATINFQLNFSLNVFVLDSNKQAASSKVAFFMKKDVTFTVLYIKVEYPM